MSRRRYFEEQRSGMVFLTEKTQQVVLILEEMVEVEDL